MRPQLGCYGHEFMKTPHIDNLSKTGLHFDFAYTNFAYCAPSRNRSVAARSTREFFCQTNYATGWLTPPARPVAAVRA